MRGITIAILLSLCRVLYAQQSAIEGTAIDTSTHQPMAGVHIMLRPMGTSGRPSDDVVTYGALSRKDGHFSISGIAPAVYFLQAEHNGYALLPGKSATISLKPGEQRADVTVAMSPRAVIVGHVLDEYGDPVERIQVMATPAPGSSTAPVQSDPTDERGLFRLPVAPGKYYVSADVRYRQPTREIRNDGRDTSVYGTTYYPSAVSEAQANPVEAAAGQEITGIDIHPARKQTFTIGGTVTGIPQGAPMPELLLFTSSGYPMRPALSIAGSGGFLITGIAAGSYRLMAVLQSSALPLRSPPVEVDAGAVPGAGVNLTLVHGETVPGTLVIEGDPPKPAPEEKLIVLLDSDSNPPQSPFGEGMNPKGAEVGKDGAFRVEQVFPGKLSVRVEPLPENAFIKSVKLNGTEAPDEVLDLSRGVNGAVISVTLSRNGGRIEGKVLDADNNVFVAIAQSADDLDYRSLTPAEPGAKFHFSGLRPGKYRIIAVGATQFSGLYQHDSQALKALFPAAPEIEIHEGDRIETDVKLTASEKQGAKQ
jgi:hypothetical protein